MGGVGGFGGGLGLGLVEGGGNERVVYLGGFWVGAREGGEGREESGEGEREGMS